MKSPASSSSSSSSFPKKLPVLDISKYYTDRDGFVEELRQACHKVGFFLIQHDSTSTANSTGSTSSSITQQMLNETRQFFQRPLHEKMTISYEHSPSFRGYMPMGVENTSGNIDYREQVEYAVEYPNYNNNNNNSNCLWPVYQRLKCPTNPWPNSFQPSLQPTTIEFAKYVCTIADIIRDSLCLALNLHPNVLQEMFVGNKKRNTKTKTRNDNNNKNDDNTKQQQQSFNGMNNHDNTTSLDDIDIDIDHDDEVPHWVVKLISYPPVPSDNNNNDDNNNTLEQGVGAHTDTNFLTLVLQDDVGGLQAFSQGEWIDVPTSITTEYNDNNNDNDTNNIHNNNSSSSTSTTTTRRSSSCIASPNLLVCNLGEQAEIWSRGYFLATPHRVLKHTMSKTTNRISVPLFYNPILSARIQPIDESWMLSENVKWERPKQYDDDTHWRRRDNIMLHTVGDNTFKSLARSHPHVFQKHHPDLQLNPDGSIIVRKRTKSTTTKSTKSTKTI